MSEKGYWAKYRCEKVEEAVKAAKKLFSENKIENVKMTDIAKECNIGVASLYRYFSTKEAIAIEVGKLWWRQIKDFLKPRFEDENYLRKNGIDRIEAILDAYSFLFEKQRDFLLFLDDFDSFCLRENIAKEKLEDYQSETADFYKPYAEALRLGREDGTVRDGINEELTYLAVNHTMLSLLRKASEGIILTQDENYEAELNLIKEIILTYFKKSGGNAK